MKRLLEEGSADNALSRSKSNKKRHGDLTISFDSSKKVNMELFDSIHSVNRN